MVHTQQRKHSFLRGLIIPGFCILLLAYFIYHAFNGQYGMNAQLVMENQALELEYRLASLTRERADLAKKVKMLKNGSLQKDLVDERARYNLNLVRDDEIVISLND